MILDSVSSFIDNIKNKVTNPFFGTLIFVWSVRNWKLIFNLFNFDENCSRYDRLEIIKSYVSKNWFEEISINIGVTIIVMILGYFFLMVSRFMANFVEYNLTPKMNKYIAEKTLVTDKLLLVEAENDMRRKSEELIKERSYSNELEVRITDFKKKLNETEVELQIIKEKNSELIKENSELEALEKKNESLLADNRKLMSDKSSLNERLYKTDLIWRVKIKLEKEYNLPFHVIDAYIDIYDLKFVRAFRDISNNVINKIDPENHDGYNKNMIKAFVENDLMRIKKSQKKYDGIELEMTDVGIILNDRIDLIEKEMRAMKIIS